MFLSIKINKIIDIFNINNVYPYILKNKKEILKISLIVLIILFGTYERYKVFDESGGELKTNEEAVLFFLNKESPYNHTVNTFEHPELYIDHGYAYFPTLMYMHIPLYLLHLHIEFPLQRLWKIPVLLADIGICVMLLIHLYKKSYIFSLFSILIWFFNPYFIVKHTYSYTEPYGVFFLLLALFFLEKDDILSGLFYAIAISFKAFPIVLLPLFLFKSKDRFKFLLSSATFALIISIPFLKNLQTFTDYIRGSLFVHSIREPQGRPILFFIKYYTGLPIFSVALASVFVKIATLSGWVITVVLYSLKKIRDKYILSAISFFLFYVFTPVLTRTYLIWFIPILILGSYQAFYKGKTKWVTYVLLISFYIFYAWYLSIWDRGVRVFGDFISL